MWIVYAFLAALTAALVAIFAKVGLRDMDTTIATTLRSLIMAVFLVTFAWSIGAAHSLLGRLVGAFLRGQFVVMCSLAVIYSTGLWLVGLQLALLLGLASAGAHGALLVGLLAASFSCWATFQVCG